jgi:hypothetical protein
MFMIGFPAGIRLIVTTANLLYTDFHNKCNGVWSQDFRKKDLKKGAFAAPQTEFERTLCEYMQTMTVHSEKISQFPGAMDSDGSLIDLLHEYDYRGATGHLVATVPGPHCVLFSIACELLAQLHFALLLAPTQITLFATLCAVALILTADTRTRLSPTRKYE